jgi:5-methylcytosine-specific restriction protein A
METALFINGVFESVLTGILHAQNVLHAEESFLQPHSGSVIQTLGKHLPTPSSPIRLYVSTSKNLNNICFTAEIIKWEEKSKISELRRQAVRQHLKKFQPIEEEGIDDKTQTNLITIRNLQKLETQLSTGLLIKTSDKQPLKARKPPGGGWSEVYDDALFAITESETEETNNRKLAKEIAESKKLAANVLKKRLETAPKIPERVQIISVGFRRNADVIVAVLNRANGICERCKKKAPFIRKSDGTPFLEVHHKITLAEGGEDTVENALALCPNCHREVHHG